MDTSRTSEAGRHLGRVVLVTGAGGGIGRAIAKRFAAEGAAVAVNERPGSESGEATVEAIESSGGIAILALADVTDQAAVYAMVAYVVEHLGPIDVLVNNAAVSSHVPFLELSAEEWNRIISVNLTGVFICAREVAPAMVSRGSGVIINIASELAYSGAEDLAHYSAAKGGVVTLTKAMARELAPDVRVNAVAPGATETELLTRYPDEYNDETLATIPLGRWGQPVDAAATVSFLASDDASYYTGWVLSPNGGAVM